MLRDEMIEFEQLSGEEASLKTIGRIGGFLDGYQKAMEKQQWIPCSERMPRFNMEVLTYRKGLAMPMFVDAYEGYYGEDDDEWYEGWRFGTKKTVTAWMPLPEL